MTDKERYAEKIAKLLAKAESTTPEEAELLIAKAQELMTEYAITEAMVREREGKPREEIVEESLSYKGVYSLAYLDLSKEVARYNNCRNLQSKNHYPAGHTHYIIGFESDVARAKMLISSLQIQASAAVTKWAKGGGTEGMWDNNEKTRARRDFLFGFAQGVGHKLYEAEQKGQEEAAHQEAERSGVSEEEASESVALIVRSRADQVKDWQDKKYGKLRTARGRRSYGNYGAEGAGRSAGLSANTSTSNVGSGVSGTLGSGH